MSKIIYKMARLKSKTIPRLRETPRHLILSGVDEKILVQEFIERLKDEEDEENRKFEKFNGTIIETQFYGDRY